MYVLCMYSCIVYMYLYGKYVFMYVYILCGRDVVKMWIFMCMYVLCGKDVNIYVHVRIMW